MRTGVIKAEKRYRKKLKGVVSFLEALMEVDYNEVTILNFASPYRRLL